MKKQKKLTIMLLLLSYIEPVMAMEVVKCGGFNNVPYKIISFIGNIINTIKIIVPVLLIIMGIVDMAKAVVSNDDKKMKESTKTFIKRTIYAVLVFFVIAIVQFVFKTLEKSMADKENDLLSCVSCIIGNDCLKEQYSTGSSSSNTENSNDSSRNSSNKSSNSKIKKDNKVIIVGASKICQLAGTYSNNYVSKFSIDYKNYTKNTNLFFVCKGGQGYEWLNQTAISTVTNIIDKKTSTSKNIYVIFEIGGNDLRTPNTSKKVQEVGKKYAVLYNKTAKDWNEKYSNVKVYAFSLDPFKESNSKNNKIKDKGYDVGYKTNDKAKSFNKGLKDNLSNNVKYKNIFTYFYTGKGKSKYNTVDGIHYTKNTAQVVYEKIINSI